MSKYQDTGEKIFIADKETQDAIKAETASIKTDTTAIKAELDKVYTNTVQLSPIFGFIEHNDIAEPASRIEYIGENRDYTPITVTMGGGYSLGSWGGFPWLVENRPYMVHNDGTADYPLLETDYTKKADGVTPSDVSNTSYEGGAFSWCRKIYSREYMAGRDRVRLFSMIPREGFEATGFIDEHGNEMPGVWIPMFYGANQGGKMVSLSGLHPEHDVTTDAQWQEIQAVGEQARFFGGAITHVLVDLEIMFAKTTDLQKAYGQGNCSGYSAELAPTYGVKENAVVGGGQFYGTSGGKTLNKIFHSIVLGSYQIWCRDPYMLEVDGKFKVSPRYAYDVTGETYQDAGITVPDDETGWDGNNNKMTFPKFYQTIPGFGNLPAETMDGGSNATYGCDGTWWHKPSVKWTSVSLRFGNCDFGLTGGGRSFAFNVAAGLALWHFGAALLLLAPVAPEA